MSAPLYVFKTTALALAAMVVVFFAVGQLLNKTWEVKTTRLVKASPERCGAVLGDLATWAAWYAAKVDLGNPTKTEVQGTPGTVGHALVWTGPMGKASLTFTSVTAGAIGYDYGVMVADGSKGGRGTGRVDYAASADGCTVTWTDGGVWDGLLARWFGWFGALQERCKQIHNASLTGLQLQLEEAAKPAGSEAKASEAPKVGEAQKASDGAKAGEPANAPR